VTRLLRANGVELRVIDLNDETVAKLERDGIPALYGDASQIEVLRAAGVAHAKIVISTAATTSEQIIIESVKELNPASEVFVRANYVGQSTKLNEAGADVVITGEGEVGLALAERVLARFGASPDELQQERQRLRAEFGM
jgi:CPA2 family monovalent cation:H+ antiporter-2